MRREAPRTPLSRGIVLQATVLFALLMAGLYVLRPLRDELGIQSGVENMQWLFTGTFVVVLVLAPLYALSVRALGRSISPVLFAAAAVACVGCRAVAWATPQAYASLFAAGTFVGLSAFNLLAVSVFWTLVVDVFSREHATRTFGVISAGGTVGALVGPVLAGGLVQWLAPRDLLIAAAALLLAGSGLAASLARHARDTTPQRSAPDLRDWARGLRVTAKHPRLRGIAVYLLCMTWVSTVLYFEQARVIGGADLDPQQRTTLFAGVDLAVNLVALLLLLGVTGRWMRRFGVGALLVALPAVAGLAVASIAAAPILAVVVVAQAVRRASNYAFSRPAREVLFTDVPRGAKYEGKHVVDTVVYRGGDAVAGWGFAGLEALGLGLEAIGWGTLPVVAGWALLAHRLGRRSGRPTSSTADPSTELPTEGGR